LAHHNAIQIVLCVKLNEKRTYRPMDSRYSQNIVR
jgi:hypothetical protein